MKVLDLFSGLGGFSLGLERAGMTTVQFCEIDPFCQAVLKKHWPEVPCHGDVRTLPGVGCDLVSGGFPCQPWSTAGRRKGEEDGRHLWPAMLEVIRRERPTWVCGENVAGLISLGLDQVLSDLESLSYACRPLVIPALAVGAVHRRDRVWIVAHAGSRRRPGSRRAKEPGDQAAHGDRQAAQPFDALRWPTEPPVRGANDGLSRRLDRDRLRALGNSIVPAIAEMIGRAIMEAEHP